MVLLAYYSYIIVFYYHLLTLYAYIIMIMFNYRKVQWLTTEGTVAIIMHADAAWAPIHFSNKIDFIKTTFASKK